MGCGRLMHSHFPVLADELLYRRYDITKIEIIFINPKIRPMEMADE